MKQIFAWLFAAIFFAAGCAQSPDLAEPVRGGGYENADGLVIVAACPPATRTDIEEGKSTWEAGDRITVVYDGAAYEYTAAEAGPTTAFTSEAGIADYDASKPLTAYYPATTAEGVVAVEAERTIALDAESQSNPARAPLVGLPTSGNLAEGALEVTFRNIFSVIELRIDAGELASAAQSLTAEPEFGVNLSSVELNAQGSNAAVVQLSSVDYDWTVSADGDWVHVTDLSDAPVVSGVRDSGVQYIKIGAGANTKTAPRSAVVTFASTDGAKSATVKVDQQARGEAFPSKWVFQASTLPLYGSSWTDDNVIPATSGAAGFISVVRGDANASAAFKRSVVTNRPAVSTMVEGDYWLYTFPVENLAAGSVVDFNATMAGEANSPKYFIVEYLDGGVWKSVEADLLTAPENPAVRYTYKCSGTATGSSYQHATVMQTMRFENAVTDGEVKIRCRAVGPYTCAGGTQNITATNAASSIPPYGFTGSYVQNFGTATPRDTKKVLCLGNSFSYYSNPAWMLKEIAWREGHALNIKAHFKGAQTLTQHLSLGFSTDVIEQGGYDFAFLQDQSQNPANYGRDATASILTGLTTLADKVRAASPSCKVILEETWTFSSASYGGFTDFPTFETYNDAGAKAMAKAAGTWVSPIGPAFRQVREGGSGINLYYSDSKHQSEYGAYLKACVNYLVLFGERFGADPADCGLNPDKAAYLRSVAEQIVLGNEGDYFIER